MAHPLDVSASVSCAVNASREAERVRSAAWRALASRVDRLEAQAAALAQAHTRSPNRTSADRLAGEEAPRSVAAAQAPLGDASQPLRFRSSDRPADRLWEANGDADTGNVIDQLRYSDAEFVYRVRIRARLDSIVGCAANNVAPLGACTAKCSSTSGTACKTSRMRKVGARVRRIYRRLFEGLSDATHRLHAAQR